MERDDLVYVAGFFDGEGCIMINKQRLVHKNKHKPDGEYVLYQLQVTISQNEPCPILYELQKVYGGKVHRKTQARTTMTNLMWGIQSGIAAAFLADILPFLRLKADQAKLGIEFQSRLGRRGSRMTDEERQTRDGMHHKMRSMKNNMHAMQRHVND